ncbi:DUF535 family protein [Kingella negevensis]|uniref:VirK/YbjX family protein n=1 Tax=Kingella negevensis TaxID=1522312 RepID=UPI0025438FC2|nr:DUF535 family protein [Kingella negevensis]MDK4680340.1 DUF535 family protein [Kingella negevensis]MDK4681939.1 DUF535 family protein [Kingella negevensis]MDK4690135.1 DUF535 family protein [Kingella negevensis]MDK4692519.1 DUF535 family protein [Kingella negevensis]MDK4698820.1 DUF535 family protein [Kingella negevensis]
MIQTFKFPHFRQIYTQASYFSWQNVKFQARRLRTGKTIHQLEDWVNQRNETIDLFTQTEKIAYPILNTYLDKRLKPAHKRFEVMKYDVRKMQLLADGKVFAQLIQGNALLIASLNEDLYFQLGINDLDVNEGLWSLSLRSKENERLYAASFGFLPDNSLLIASLQGPRGDDGKEKVRVLTKEFYGLRPQILTVAVLQMLAKYAKCARIVGIAQAQQVKLRGSLKKRVAMNYDEFWQECDGQLQADGYWLLPAAYERKDEAEIASKKRSMYRKRYEMLDKIEADLQIDLQGETIIASAA